MAGVRAQRHEASENAAHLCTTYPFASAFGFEQGARVSPGFEVREMAFAPGRGKGWAAASRASPWLSPRSTSPQLGRCRSRAAAGRAPPALPPCRRWWAPACVSAVLWAGRTESSLAGWALLNSSLYFSVEFPARLSHLRRAKSVQDFFEGRRRVAQPLHEARVAQCLAEHGGRGAALALCVCARESVR